MKFLLIYNLLNIIYCIKAQKQEFKTKLLLNTPIFKSHFSKYKFQCLFFITIFHNMFFLAMLNFKHPKIILHIFIASTSGRYLFTILNASSVTSFIIMANSSVEVFSLIFFHISRIS